MSQNWRTEIDAQDYFGHQKKQLQVADRRPVIRKASDLVGPGIGAAATRVTDFNNLLATYNGFYAGEAGALNAPTDDEPYIGQTVMDSELGGKQMLTGLSSEAEYTRVFLRNPGDPESLSWGVWRNNGPVVSSARAITPLATTVVPSGSVTELIPPPLNLIGPTGTYGVDASSVKILRQGAYTGLISINGAAATLTQLTLRVPDMLGVRIYPEENVDFSSAIIRPFTFLAAGAGSIQIEVEHTDGANRNIRWDSVQITRVGDVI